MTAPDQTRPIRALLPMPCDGAGPAATCLNLMSGAARAGYAAEVFACRRRVPRPAVPMRLALPGPLGWLPYQRVQDAARRRTEAMFLSSVREGDVAYLWPAASLKAHEELHARGVTVVMEGINTRMASARRILDAAYEAFGIPPAHGITQRRIDVEEEKYRHADAIFAPNPEVEKALAGSPLEHRILPASYGVDVSRASPERDYPQKDALTILFVGTVCVRKGAHHLIEAFRRLGGRHRLRLLGSIEPAIAERYADLLGSDRVEAPGFVADVHPEFARADIFVMPSLEEGGPQVTYEAAIHGLPILASPMGAGRLGEVPGALRVVEPSDIDAMAAALDELVRSAGLRADLGRTARAAAPRFDWGRIGPERAAAMLRLAG